MVQPTASPPRPYLPELPQVEFLKEPEDICLCDAWHVWSSDFMGRFPIVQCPQHSPPPPLTQRKWTPALSKADKPIDLDREKADDAEEEELVPRRLILRIPRGVAKRVRAEILEEPRLEDEESSYSGMSTLSASEDSSSSSEEERSESPVQEKEYIAVRPKKRARSGGTAVRWTEQRCKFLQTLIGSLKDELSPKGFGNYPKIHAEWIRQDEAGDAPCKSVPSVSAISQHLGLRTHASREHACATAYDPYRLHRKKRATAAGASTDE